MGDVIVSMEHITKEFPGVKALDDVKFNLRSGEVMALLGENGAGKSTLMKILSGVYSLDQGSLKIFGKDYSSLTPSSAREAGVAIIHQELNMCKDLTVAQNMFLGREERKGFVLNKDWIARLDAVISLNGRELLTHAGKISHEMAIAKSELEYKKFKDEQKKIEKIQSLKELEEDIKRLK